MSLKEIPFGSLEAFNVIVEIPQGSNLKYEYDEKLSHRTTHRYRHGLLN